MGSQVGRLEAGRGGSQLELESPSGGLSIGTPAWAQCGGRMLRDRTRMLSSYTPWGGGPMLHNSP